MKKQTDHEFKAGFGKMVKGKHSVLLDEGQLSDTQNMQPGFWWKQRRGMAGLTTSAVASGLRWKSGIQFRDLKGNTNVILMHTYDSSGGEDIYQGSALPPNAITWSKKYDLTASCEKCQFANVANALLVANNKEFLIWRGTQHNPTGVWYFADTTDKFINFYEEMVDGSTSTYMTLNSMTAGDLVYVLAEMPMNELMLTMGNTNSTASWLLVEYWTGVWTLLRRASWWASTEYLDDDCDSLTGWDDDDGGDGNTTQTTFLNREVFCLDAESAGGANFAGISRDVGTLGATCAISVLAYHSNIGTKANADDFLIQVDNGDVLCAVRIATDDIHVYDGGSWNATSASKAGDEGEWILWTLVIDSTTPASATVDIYANGTKVVTAADCSDTGGTATDGDIVLKQYGDTTADQITYLRQICVGDSLDTTGDALVDSTVSSSATLGQTEDINWTAPGDEVQTVIQGIPGYAVRFGPSLTIDASVTLTGLQVHTPMAEVKNVWDGKTILPSGCYVYDGSDYTDAILYVANTVESQYADLSGGTTSYDLYVGFPQRVKEIILWPAADGKNAADAQVDYVGYFNASGTVTSLTFTDTTLDDAADTSFAQKGSLYWNDPGRYVEKATTIAGDRVPKYWYKIEWDATLTDPTYIYHIRGVPSVDPPDYSRGVFAYKRRAWQIAPLNWENAVRYSAANLPNVWNGQDSGYVEFGERPLIAAAPFYNEAILYADTEMWMLQGNAPTNFGRLRLSSKVGTVSPESVLAIETGVVVQDQLKVVIAWFFYDGIWMFDGVRLWKISAPDIDSFFDPDHADYIPAAQLGQTTGVYDYNTQLAMWNVYSGSGATTPTKTIVMHFPTLTFGIFDYASDLDAMVSVVNSRYYICAGGNSNGMYYQLDSGITDLAAATATAVDAYVITKDEFLSYSEGTRQRLMSIWMEAQSAGGQIELDEYPDGSKTPQNVAKQSMTFKGKIFGVLQKGLKYFQGQKTVKYRIRNRSTKARMNLLGKSVTVDRDRSEV